MKATKNIQSNWNHQTREVTNTQSAACTISEIITTFSRDLVPSVASNLNPFRARRQKFSQADIYAKERQLGNQFFASTDEIFVWKSPSASLRYSEGN